MKKVLAGLIFSLALFFGASISAHAQTLSGTYVGQGTGPVGQNCSTNPSNDEHVTLSGLKTSTSITQVVVTSTNGNGDKWVTPCNGVNWIIQLVQSGSTADIYFAVSQADSSYNITVTYADTTTASTTVSKGTPTPTPSGSPTPTPCGITYSGTAPGGTISANCPVSAPTFITVVSTPTPTPTATPTPTTLTMTLVLTSANNGKVYNNYRISTTSGPCVQFNGVSNATITNSNIGPCGGSSGSKTTGDSNAIEFASGTTNSSNGVYDSYIHGETYAAAGSAADYHDCLYEGSNGGGSNSFQGNVFAFCERGVVFDDHGEVGDTANGNFFLNDHSGDISSGNGCGFGAGACQANAIFDGGKGNTSSNNYVVNCKVGASVAGQELQCSKIPNFNAAGVIEDAVSDDNIIINNTNSSLTGGTTTVSTNYELGGGYNPSSTCYLIRSSYGTLSLINNTGADCSNQSAGPLFINSGSGTASNFNLFTNYSGAHGGQLAFNAGNAGTGPWTNGSWTISNSLTRDIDNTNDNGSLCWTSPGTLGSCSGIITETSSTFGPGAFPSLGLSSTISQIIAVLGTPPLIPPVPKNCVVKSPFSTQTSVASCP